jgi:hypothetical protein
MANIEGSKKLKVHSLTWKKEKVNIEKINSGKIQIRNEARCLIRLAIKIKTEGDKGLGKPRLNLWKWRFNCGRHSIFFQK